MNEIDHSFATQRLLQLGNKILIANKQILTYKGGAKYPIQKINTAIQKGQLLIEASQQIQTIDEADLSSRGYCVDYDSGRGRIYLSRIKPGIKGIKIPYGHYAEMDVVNKKIRLQGRSADTQWLSLNQSQEASQEKSPEEIIAEYYSLGEKEEVVEPVVHVKELPFMISNQGELVCFPVERDEATIGIVGSRGSGKSFTLHGIADRAYWKMGKRVAILNDSQTECGSWALPWIFENHSVYTHPAIVKDLVKINETTLPLPVVFLNPISNADGGTLLPDSGVSHKISFPFKELVNHAHVYFQRKEWQLGKSARYFTNVAANISLCKDMDEIEEVIINLVSGKGGEGVRGKIIEIMRNLFNLRFLNLNTGVNAYWGINLKNGHSGKYTPVTACLLAGVVPVLETANLESEPIFQPFYRYLVYDIFIRQSVDPYFIKNEIQIWPFIDELQTISSTKMPGIAADILERCAKEGRPRRIGFVYATQNYSFISRKIRSNTSYVLAFRFNNAKETGTIGEDFDLSIEQKKKLLHLKKLEMMAMTTNKFVCYDMFGTRRESDPGETFVGKALPPLSQHKAPSKAAKKEEVK